MRNKEAAVSIVSCCWPSGLRLCPEQLCGHVSLCCVNTRTPSASPRRPSNVPPQTRPLLPAGLAAMALRNWGEFEFRWRTCFYCMKECSVSKPSERVEILLYFFSFSNVKFSYSLLGRACSDNTAIFFLFYLLKKKNREKIYWHAERSFSRCEITSPRSGWCLKGTAKGQPCNDMFQLMGGCQRQHWGRA